MSVQYVGVDDDGDGDGGGGGGGDGDGGGCDDDDTRGRTDDAKDEIKSVLFHGLHIPSSKFFKFTPRIHYT